MKSTSLCDKGRWGFESISAIWWWQTKYPMEVVMLGLLAVVWYSGPAIQCHETLPFIFPGSKKDAEASSVMMLNIFGPICIGIGIEFKQRRGHQQGCGNIMNKWSMRWPFLWGVRCEVQYRTMTLCNSFSKPCLSIL